MASQDCLTKIKRSLAWERKYPEYKKARELLEENRKKNRDTMKYLEFKSWYDSEEIKLDQLGFKLDRKGPKDFKEDLESEYEKPYNKDHFEF